MFCMAMGWGCSDQGRSASLNALFFDPWASLRPGDRRSPIRESRPLSSPIGQSLCYSHLNGWLSIESDRSTIRIAATVSPPGRPWLSGWPLCRDFPGMILCRYEGIPIMIVCTQKNYRPTAPRLPPWDVSAQPNSARGGGPRVSTAGILSRRRRPGGPSRRRRAAR